MNEFLDTWPGWLRNLAFRLTGIRAANRLLAHAAEASSADGRFMTRILEDLQVHCRFVGHNGHGHAPDGPVIYAANHPHGLIDALALASLAEHHNRRPTLMARHFLTVFAPLRPFLLPLVVRQDRSVVNGRQQFLAAQRALAQGRVIVITPAGRLSLPPGIAQPASDPPWRSGLVRLARVSSATIVPVTLSMTIPRWVYWMHRVHPIARSIVQVWQLLLRRPQTVLVHVHDPVLPDELANMSDRDATVWLQARVCGSPNRPESATRMSEEDH